MSDIVFSFKTGESIRFDVESKRDYITEKLIASKQFDEFSAASYASSIIDDGAFSQENLDAIINQTIEKRSSGKKSFNQKGNGNDISANFALTGNKSESGIFSRDVGITEEEDYFVFYPSKRDMKTDYPELAANIAFKDLSNREMIFIWFYANMTSPYRELEEKHKIGLCIKEAWGGKLNKEDVDAYLDGNFPEKIRVACLAMKKYKPSVRMKAQMMKEKVLSDYQIILSQNVNKMTPDQQYQYVTTAQKINASLTDLVSSIEDGFGIKVKQGKDMIAENEMDIILQEDEKIDYDL